MTTRTCAPARPGPSVAVLFCAVLAAASGSAVAQKPAAPAYLDPELPSDQRAADLVSRLTLDEKVSQLTNDAPAIPRLGSRRTSGGTSACTASRGPVRRRSSRRPSAWRPPSMRRCCTKWPPAVSDEARAKHHEFERRGLRARYQGLTFWSPNINIFRDPRWGRGQETYGEDPFLTVAHGRRLRHRLAGRRPAATSRSIATAKHYAVHSGPEADRHRFDVHPSERDLYETYLPAFRALVQEAKVESVMGAYNRVNGESASAQLAPAAGHPAQGLGLQRLRRVRLRRDRRHLPRPPDRRHRGTSGGDSE